MHFRNGREAKNGDTIVQLDSEGKICGFGVLFGAQAGNDYCNGYVAPIATNKTIACLCDCIHADDLAALLAEKGLDKRPPPKAS